MPDRTPLTVVGDALLDRDVTGSADRLAPDAPVPVIAECAEHLRPGGAALAACLAARDGREVTLITGAGDDEAGRALATLIRLVGDFDLAEDALQEAVAVALERWPAAGLPAR